MPLKINSASGSITLTAEDGSGNADVTIPRGGFVGSLSDLSVTATAAEINKLDGVTATTAELNYVDGVTSNIQTQLDAKGTVSSLSDLSVTATAAEINKLDGVTATTAELNYVDGVTSAIQTQIDGKLSTSGGTLTGNVNMTSGNLTLNDGRVFYSGTSNDFSINHSGSDTYLSNNTGDIYLRNFANDSDIILQTDNSIGGTTNYIICDGGTGSVKLYNYGSQKLYTSSSGVVVQGTVTASSGIDCNGQLDINEVVEFVFTSTSTTGTLTYDTQSYGVAFYTANQTANRTINFSNVNSNLTNGQSITSSVLMTQGSTAYYLNAYQVDGTAVTPKWSGGTAPSAGNASGIDVYTFTIIKTADATFTVLASLTQYA